MEFSNFLGKSLNEVEKLLESNSYELIEILSPKKDILGEDKRVIKIEKNEKLIIYYYPFYSNIPFNYYIIL